ncbi:MAG: hypothetical protein WAV76_08620 [Bacteroidota bacterium]
MNKTITIFIFLVSLISFVHFALCQDYYDSDNHYQYTYKINPHLPDFVFSVFLDTLESTGESTHRVSKIEIRNSNSMQIIQTITIPEKSEDLPCYGSTSFCVRDMNFDGYIDILLNYSGGSAGDQFHVWLYNTKSGIFIYDPQFDELWDPAPDPKRKTITSICSGGYKNTMKVIYRIENGILVLLRKEIKTYIDEVNGNKRWERRVELYKRDKITSVKIDTIKEE